MERLLNGEVLDMSHGGQTAFPRRNSNACTGPMPHLRHDHQRSSPDIDGCTPARPDRPASRLPRNADKDIPMHKFIQFLFRRSVHGRETTPAQARLLANLRLTALGVVYAGDDFDAPNAGPAALASHGLAAPREPVGWVQSVRHFLGKAIVSKRR